MREVKKQYVVFAGLFAITALTVLSIYQTRPTISYMVIILSIPALVYLILRLGEKE